MQTEYLADKVAIILPVYNSSKYLEKCLESILNQTHENFTIFAIDDGSTDDSLKIVNQFAFRDSRIVVIHKNNEGVGAARNYALNLIEKQNVFSYISFVDSDDVLSPIFLNSHLKHLKEIDADVSICGFLLIGDNGHLHQPHPPLSERKFDSDEYINVIFSKNEWSNGSGAGGMVWKQVYRAKVIQSIRFSEDPSVVEDELFGVMVAQRAKLFVYFPDPLYFYRQSSTSLCKDKNWQISRFKGRKLCFHNCENISEIARLVVFTSYIESILSLMKQNLLTIDLNSYRILVGRAYNAGAMDKKTLLIFYLFNKCPLCSMAYIHLRIAFRKLRSLLGLRI